MSKKDEPAFPVMNLNSDQMLATQFVGLSKRELFAAMAMQGMLASFAGTVVSPKPKNVAFYSVDYADALLVELEKEPS